MKRPEPNVAEIEQLEAETQHFHAVWKATPSLGSIRDQSPVPVGNVAALRRSCLFATANIQCCNARRRERLPTSTAPWLRPRALSPPIRLQDCCGTCHSPAAAQLPCAKRRARARIASAVHSRGLGRCTLGYW